MSKPTPLLIAAALAAIGTLATFADAGPAFAQRYGERQPIAVPSHVAEPWVMQLQRRQLPSRSARSVGRLPKGYAMTVAPRPRALPVPGRAPAAQAYVPTDRTYRSGASQAAIAATSLPPAQHALSPTYLPQVVDYPGREKPGTIDIDTKNRFLYHVLPDGKAKRYGVGVGKEGFGWTGTERITQKKEWPSWRPPAQMIERERKKGRELPTFMAGGEANPLGARALYLGSTLYRIHGTNAPWTIGQNVSSGCFRMRNEDVSALYAEVGVGTKVVVR